ncbi:MAG TPA: hypothetical protein VHB98_05070, partial [Chloroflexota bacterium]|nr:hypothetical protein [Chloroflexota bacterium]
MPTEQVILVAVEDSATAGVVAAAAAQVAMAQNATTLVLLHVLDEHVVASGMYALVGCAVPLAETTEEGEQLLAYAEMAFRAEYTALERPMPRITHTLVGGEAA